MPMSRSPDEAGAQQFLVASQPQPHLGPHPYPTSGSDSLTWPEMAEAVRRRVERASHLRDRRVGLVLRPRPEAFVWLLALRELSATAVLLAANTAPEQVASLTDSLDLEFLVDGDDPQPGKSPATASASGNEPRIVLLTSGTTGTPKAVMHSWESLSRPVRTTPGLHGSRWLLTFAPHLYAGLQVFLHAWLNQGTLVLLPPGWTPEAALETMAEQRVGYVSATPSFWRYVLLSTTRDQQRRCELIQITLGGESTDQALLDRLKAAFPAARLVHIYATTELGRCFSVTDGREGFPAAWLGHPTEEGIALQVDADAGELLVRSANRMIGYAGPAVTGAVVSAGDGWIRTGDDVEIVGDRVVFRGRKTDVANVGGQKVSLVAVEEFLRTLAEVEDALVYSVPSSMAGELLGADLVLRPGLEPASAKDAVVRSCAQTLAPPMRPRFWKLVDAIPLLPGGKRIRRRETARS